jgi:glycosyltransferase involved in cell wall biosynthesis
MGPDLEGWPVVKIVGFSEGPRGDSPGIVSVPTILKSTAEHGHQVVLLMGGAVNAGSEAYVIPDSNVALTRKQGEGTFGIVIVKAWTHWRFCPEILWRFRKLVRSADFVMVHSLYSFPVLAGYLMARMYGKPYGIYPHGVLAPFQRQVSAQRKALYNKLFVNQILDHASVIFFSAEGEREETRPLKLRAPSVIVPDGFDPSGFAVLPERGRFRARFFRGHTGPLVLFLARLNAKKGLDLLIEAMAEVIRERPDARLAIVGPPDPAPFRKQVQQWVKDAGIDAQTVLTGNADAEMRLEAFADSDVYVLPSHAENFGFSVFEAMACGVPVVVSETLNFAREFAAGGAGVALPRSAKEFSTAIVNLLDRPDLRRQMGARGKQFARQYSQEETGAKVAATIESIVERRTLPANLAPMLAGGAR